MSAIAIDATSPKPVREKADQIRALMRVMDERESAKAAKERFLGLYPENSGQALYINMVYEAVEKLLGSDESAAGMDKVNLIIAVRQLACFGTDPGSIRELFVSDDTAPARPSALAGQHAS